MKNSIVALVGIAVGAVVSAIVTKKMVERKADIRIQEECDHYKEVVKTKVLKADNIEQHDAVVAAEAVNNFIDENHLDKAKTDIQALKDSFKTKEKKSYDKKKTDEKQYEELADRYSGSKSLTAEEFRRQYGVAESYMEEDEEEVITGGKEERIERTPCEKISEERFERLMGDDDIDGYFVTYDITDDSLTMGSIPVDPSEIGGLEMLEGVKDGDEVHIYNPGFKLLYDITVIESHV